MVPASQDSPFPEIYSDDEWVTYVGEGRSLVEQELRIQFALGDLTLRMVSADKGPGGGDRGVFRVLSRYADEIGLPYSTLVGYRHMSLAWPPEKRNPTVSFSIQRALDAHPDRWTLIFEPPEGLIEWTLDAALRFAERRPKTPESIEEKVDRAQTLLRDEESAVAAVAMLVQRPHVAERVIADPQVRRSLLGDDDNMRLQP